MFTAVYRKSGKWWAAYVEEVPGVNTQGATLAEARANLKEALALILQTNRELAREKERDIDCIREPVSVDA
jgi:predicted RNase H-like HicB family nuclease